MKRLSTWFKGTKPIFGCKVDSVSGNLFVDECMQFLLTHGGVELEGIFRLGGSKTKILEYKKLFDSGKKSKFDIVEDKLLDVAGLFKLFFRELKPEPLLTYTLYESFISAVQEKNREKPMVSKLLDLLPIPNMVMLLKLMSFLKKFSDNEWKTKMNPRNLAICFAPNIIGGQNESIDQVVANTFHITNLVTLLLENYNYFFSKFDAVVKEIEIAAEDIAAEGGLDEIKEDPNATPITKKERERMEKEKKKAQEEEFERQLQLAEKERQELAKEKAERLEKRKQLNQMWEDKTNLVTPTSSPGTPTSKTPDEVKARMENRKLMNEKWQQTTGATPVEIQRARKAQAKAREEERQTKMESSNEMKEANLIKKEMERKYSAREESRKEALESHKEAMNCKGISIDEFNKMQVTKFNKIRTGQYTYDDLLEWNNELNVLMTIKKKEKKKVKSPPLVISPSSAHDLREHMGSHSSDLLGSPANTERSRRLSESNPPNSERTSQRHSSRSPSPSPTPSPTTSARSSSFRLSFLRKG
eukprot:TRINITY_DN7924_c0_g1_i1.p1 TRINITY_DN7924_c0_g1~~TRINITY_DN7924_c0_g1_i1.p1  ORF type:complete len:539 (-),score=125.96 TRINITY_DN7924_c0_g1_i1:104-1693(-)